MEMIQNIDNSILQFIQINMKSSVMDKIMPLVSSIANKSVIWILIGALLLITNRYRKYGFMLILSLILCFIVGNLTIKPLVSRIRPFEAIPLINALLISAPTDFSFPSGHTMCSFAPSVVIFYMNKTTGTVALFLSAIIGFSRLYLYVHYPSDVFFGMLIGIILGIVSIVMFEAQSKK